MLRHVLEVEGRAARRLLGLLAPLAIGLGLVGVEVDPDGLLAELVVRSTLVGILEDLVGGAQRLESLLGCLVARG